MKQFAVSILACALAMGAQAQVAKGPVPVPAPTPAKPTGPAPTLADIGWLSGCWQARADSRVKNTEQWTRPTGPIMLGLGIEMRGTQLASYEFMRIESKDGKLIYTVKPHNKAETAFTQTGDNAEALVFENPKHDFPQRIIYRKEKEGQMEIRIDGKVADKTRAALFPMEKVACQ